MSNPRVKKLYRMCLRTMKLWSRWLLKEGVLQWDMLPESTELPLIGCSIESIWIPKSMSNTPKREFHSDEWNHLLNLLNTSHYSSTACIAGMAKRAQQESGEERVTAKSRPMMNLTARTPSFVSSSASSNPGRTSYGYQDPGKSVPSDDRTGKPVELSRPDFSQKDYDRSWSSQEWKSGAAEHDGSGKPEKLNLLEKADSDTLVMGSDAAEFVNKVKDQVRSRQKRMSNVAESGEEHSTIWWMFMAATMNAATFMGKNFSTIQNFTRNSEDLTLKQMFDVTAQLVNDQEEIHGLDKIHWGKNSWRKLSLIGDETKLGRTELQGSRPRKVTEIMMLSMESRLNSSGTSSRDSQSCSSVIKSMIYWATWDKHQRLSQEEFYLCQCSMTSPDRNDNEAECLANAETVKVLARRFGVGQWSFIGPGSENKWYSAENSPQWAWDHIAEDMLLEFAESGHPIFRATTHCPEAFSRAKDVENCQYTSPQINIQSVSHSSTESEIISLDPGLRLDGLPALELWDLIVSVLGNISRVSNRSGKPESDDHKHHKSHNKINVMKDIDAVPSNVQSAHQEALLFVFEDNEAVFKTIIKGRSLAMRHASRIHRVALDWLFDRINLDSKIHVKYTKNQLADILTKGNFTVMSGIICWICWTPAITVLQFALKWCRKERKKSDEERVTAKSKPMMNLVSWCSEPPGLLTQHTNIFIEDDDDMDSDTVEEPDMSLISRSFSHRWMIECERFRTNPQKMQHKTARNLRRPSRTRVRSWIHQSLRSFYALTKLWEWSIQQTKTRLACILDVDESTRLRMGNSVPNPDEDHISGKGDNSSQHHNFVHKFVSIFQAMKIPAATAAVDKELEKMEKISAWNLTKVKSKKEVIDESKDERRKSSFRLNDGHLSSEKCWIGGKTPKIQRSSCAPRWYCLPQYSLNKDLQHHKWQRQKSWMSSPLPGCVKQAADAVSAYTQEKMENVPKLLEISKSECPVNHCQVWKTQFFFWAEFVRSSLAALLWERQFEKIRETTSGLLGEKQLEKILLHYRRVLRMTMKWTLTPSQNETCRWSSHIDFEKFRTNPQKCNTRQQPTFKKKVNVHVFKITKIYFHVKK